MIDEKIHEVYKALKKDVLWRDFEDVGIDEPYAMYYYAEDELYVIWEGMLQAYQFIKARSPREAWEKRKEIWEDMMKAGSLQNEEEDYE